MQFQIGDRVVHPIHGVGTVTRLSEQQFGGDKARHYYEVTAGAHSTRLWVPIDDHGVATLRGIASKRSLGECRRLLSSAPVALDKDRKIRQIEIAERLKSGLLPALCEMVRDLRARSQKIPLGTTEETLLRRISKSLCEEWAASDETSPANALCEIEDLLQASGRV
jgi:CarD family transcriptional regulator